MPVFIIEGVWSLWSRWGPCSATCNVGVQRRRRTCRGSGQGGMQAICSGNDADVLTCNNEDCTRT